VLVQVQLWQPIHLRKADRYKLAAPVLKTDSAHTEVGALPTPSATFNLEAKPLPQRKETYASRDQIPKPTANPPKLQTQPPGSVWTKGETCFQAITALRRQAAIPIRLVAQEQSARPITGRPRSVTARDDHPQVAEIDQRLAEAGETLARYQP
jgi:hypothetical protein